MATTKIPVDTEEQFAIVNAVTGAVVKQLTRKEYYAIKRAMEWPEERAAREQREKAFSAYMSSLSSAGLGLPSNT